MTHVVVFSPHKTHDSVHSTHDVDIDLPLLRLVFEKHVVQLLPQKRNLYLSLVFELVLDAQHSTMPIPEEPH